MPGMLAQRDDAISTIDPAEATNQTDEMTMRATRQGDRRWSA